MLGYEIIDEIRPYIQNARFVCSPATNPRLQGRPTLTDISTISSTSLWKSAIGIKRCSIEHDNLTEDRLDEELWDDNFGDFDNEDLREIIDEVTDIADLVQGLRSSDCEQVAKNSHKVVSTCGNLLCPMRHWCKY